MKLHVVGPVLFNLRSWLSLDKDASICDGATMKHDRRRDWR